MKYDLGFGNAVAVRDAFLKTYHGEMVVFTADSLKDFNYPPYEGNSELVETTRKVIKRQTGNDYKHIFLTNGATGAVVIALRAFKQRGLWICHTREAPWYLRYPGMIEASGLLHNSSNHHPRPLRNGSSVILLDIPSNPLALTNEMPNLVDVPVVLDGVYFNRVYMNYQISTPKHAAYVGSYSKLLGLNGIRVGWLATNDELLADRFKELVVAEYCGLSVASMSILNNVLANFDWDFFETMSRHMLDDNREQFYKLEKYFEAKVPTVGMFYYGSTDKKCRDLLEKAGITYTLGSKLGTNDDFGRLNMGQDRSITQRAITAFLKADRIT